MYVGGTPRAESYGELLIELDTPPSRRGVAPTTSLDFAIYA